MRHGLGSEAPGLCPISRASFPAGLPGDNQDDQLRTPIEQPTAHSQLVFTPNTSPAHSAATPSIKREPK